MPAPLAATAARLSEAVAALGGAAAALSPHGPWAGALVTGPGVVALVAGARHARALALWGGAAVGALAALALHRPIQAHLGLSPTTAAWALGAAGAVLCGAFPGAFPLAAGALPGAVIGAGVALGGRPALGAAAGAVAGGVAGMAAARLVTAAFAALVGGVLTVLGLSAALASFPLARELAGRPFALAAVALVLGIAGAAFQSGRRQPSGEPEQETALEERPGEDRAG